MGTLGKRISELLSKNEMTQRNLARMTGMTDASISRYIKGERVPRSSDVAKIAMALHTTTDYLLGNEDDEREEEDPETAYRWVKSAIIRNAKVWNQEQKANLVITIFGNECT